MSLGASIEIVGEKPARGGSIVHSVFRRTDSGRKAVVLVNNNRAPITAKVDTGWKSRFIVVSPESPEPRTLNAQVQIPSRSAVVVMESD
jgi:hypothetical protein